MKCFYHSADLDGHCSGAIVLSKYPNCEMIGINYGHDFLWEKIQPQEQVIMVDFCLQPFSDMLRLNKVSTLTWIDHHKTAIEEEYKHNVQIVGSRCVDQSGCELTWKYFYPGVETPQSVYLLGRYDVWDLKADERILPFQWGLRRCNTLPDNWFLWNGLLKKDFDISSIIQHGQTILDYVASTNEKFCKAYSFETTFEGYRAICCNRGFTNSQLFDSVWDESKYDLMLTFCRLPLPKKQWTVSIYTTKKDIDAGVIAKKYGGGGHPGAAGFQCDELPFEY